MLVHFAKHWVEKVLQALSWFRNPNRFRPPAQTIFLFVLEHCSSECHEPVKVENTRSQSLRSSLLIPSRCSLPTLTSTPPN